jgi:serine acetyltransferase
MHLIRIIFGMLRLWIICVCSGGKISFKIPARLDSGTALTVRGNGRIILGKHVSINYHSHLAVTENALLRIYDDVGIGDNNVIVAREKITIGNNVMIGPNVCIYDHDHVFREQGIMRNLGYNNSPVTIEDNVWIGAGCIILKGVTIGEGSVIAAGTVVNKSIPRNSVVYSKKELMVKKRIEER